ncbi:MAG: endopeptidase La [Bryobacteraceae bacterium]|nr:endopeptidase La [Bryobacteraceae bacterium]
MSNELIQTLPLLPLKNTALFPHLLMPLSVGRTKSVAGVEAALATEEKELAIIAQKDATVEVPGHDDLYTYGTKAVVRKVARPNQNSVELLVLGVERIMLLSVEEQGDYLMAKVRVSPPPCEVSPENEALQRSVLDLAAKAIAMAQPQAQIDVSQLASSSDDPMKLVFMLASMMGLGLEKEQALLEAQSCTDALRLLHTYLSHELQVLELRSKIADQARSEMSKEQREYLLRQQMRAIQQELGEKNPEQADVEILRERLEEVDLPDEVRQEAERELKRLERLPAAAPDYHVVRTYLEYVIDLPWRVSTEDSLDISRARQVLDEDHYDLKEVKERILEHLGVLKMNPNAKAPILCFVGPPGTGKTSLGQSIARALGRKFERFSLGGMHDEAELRGHRRTYIGAMPGRLIQAVRRAGANNPLIMLDEVDKLGRDFRGDPASALLEILDPEQNNTFRDNYLDLPFDLSKVFFVTTANALETIPQPLLDRMEVLRLAGYIEEEKMQIARRYLVPRQLKQAGLTEEQCRITDETLQSLIRNYTREAGLRRLERAIARLTRKAALKYAEGNTEPVVIHPQDLVDYLGPQPFMPEEARKSVPPGVATGLAWTQVGGEVLYVEATLLPEGKDLTLTGQLGEVMQESVKAALSYIRAHAAELGIDPSAFNKNGVHLHVPAGATPKDGPSAGITAAVALASAFTRCAARTDTAMTGEITLTGLVLPIGGVKEKVLAARRAGILRVILPKANEKDLRELPDEVRQSTQFIFVERIEEALAEVVPELAERLAVLAMK